MASKSTPKNSDDDPQLPGDTLRSILSLLIVIHLFCALVGVSCILMPPSPLHGRLLTVLAPYVQTLNFDVDYTPYYLTLYADYEDQTDEAFLSQLDFNADCRIEVLPEGEDPDTDENWIVVGNVGMRAGERHKRYQRLAKAMFRLAYNEDDAATGWIAKGVAMNFYHEQQITPAGIRCRSHQPQRRSWLESGTPQQRDASHADHFITLYVATVSILDDGRVVITKQAGRGESAPPTSRFNNPSSSEPRETSS